MDSADEPGACDRHSEERIGAEPKPDLVQLSSKSSGLLRSNSMLYFRRLWRRTLEPPPDQRRRAPAPDPRRGRGHAGRPRAGRPGSRARPSPSASTRCSAQGLVYEAGGSASTGGRPPTVLAFNRDAGVVLVADLGATHARVAVSDLAGTPLAERASDLDIALGPGARPRLGRRALHRAARRGRPLARRRARDRDRRARARSSSRAGGPSNPPIMPGWDDFPIPEWFAEPLQRAGARRQRRQHHGSRRAPDALAATPSICC